MRRRTHRIFRYLTIAVVTALCICEIGLRLAIGNLPSSAAPLNPLEHRLDAVFTYRYLNADMQEATRDLTIPHFTIRNDERLTTDQPTTYSRTVWLFGSSTVWGAYVDNNGTIASYLQRDINSSGLHWRVVNMGQPGVNITIETYWLKTRDIKPGDLVIFIDGAVDLNNIVRDSHKAWQEASPSCQLAARVPLMLLSMLCNENTAGRAPLAFIEPSVIKYWDGIEKARQYSLERGAQFIHFMQPALPAHDKDLYAVLSRDDPRLIIPDAHYLDELHYDEIGHNIIAHAIYNALWQTF